MYKAYKFRLYPNNKQKELIHKTFGCTRFIYNYFLKEVDSCSLRNSIFNLEDGYKNYFEKRSNYPKFKSKLNKESYRITCIRSSYKENSYSNIEIDLKNRKIKLPKLGLVDIRGYCKLDSINGKIINVTVEKETTNKYYV